MVTTSKPLRRSFAIFALVIICGCTAKQPTIPYPVPNGWVLLESESNAEMALEGTSFYARFESPLPADEASVRYGSVLLANNAKGFNLEGPAELSDDERKNHNNNRSKFEQKHLVDASKYESGYRVRLSDEPSYFEIYAFPHNDGSIVEMLRISAL